MDVISCLWTNLNDDLAIVSTILGLEKIITYSKHKTLYLITYPILSSIQ